LSVVIVRVSPLSSHPLHETERFMFVMPAW